MTGRVFGESLKPAWNEDKINEFLNSTKGDVLVFIINHDKDANEFGELLEDHTHIYLEYTNPRKITTVANLLDVDTNFIEVVRNKKSYLRYLTHKDDLEKYQYNDSDVFTNSLVSYSELVLGNSLSDKEIAEYLVQGRGMELLGIVSASKLRTIQSFLHFENSNETLRYIKDLNDKMNTVISFVEKVENVALSFSNGLKYSVEELTGGMKMIAEEMSKARLMTASKFMR